MMFGDRSTTARHDPQARRDRPHGRHRGRHCGRHGYPRDAGHEAVGQALLISIGLAGMLAAGQLAEASLAGLTTVLNALQ